MQGPDKPGHLLIIQVVALLWMSLTTAWYIHHPQVMGRLAAGKGVSSCTTSSTALAWVPKKGEFQVLQAFIEVPSTLV